MSKLVDAIISNGLIEKVLTEVELRVLLDGTAAARYGLVNKAIKSGKLIKIRRGLYIVSEKYRRKKLSKFYLASKIKPHSFISLESALSYYEWIPEQVKSTTSITSDRKKQFLTPFGEFIYYDTPCNKYEFFTGVNRNEDIKGEPFLIASPLRALIDYIYVKKMKWIHLSYLTDSLRIDYENLMELTPENFIEMKRIYRNKRIINFLDKLQRALTK